MRMAVVNIGIVGMSVFETFVTMRMRVTFAGWIIRRVNMLVVLVMHVKMLVFKRLVHVPMLMNLCYM
jgi:hypothetical protein